MADPNPIDPRQSQSFDKLKSSLDSAAKSATNLAKTMEEAKKAMLKSSAQVLTNEQYYEQQIEKTKALGIEKSIAMGEKAKNEFIKQLKDLAKEKLITENEIAQVSESISSQSIDDRLQKESRLLSALQTKRKHDGSDDSKIERQKRKLIAETIKSKHSANAQSLREDASVARAENNFAKAEALELRASKEQNLGVAAASIFANKKISVSASETLASVRTGFNAAVEGGTDFATTLMGAAGALKYVAGGAASIFAILEILDKTRMSGNKLNSALFSMGQISEYSFLTAQTLGAQMNDTFRTAIPLSTILTFGVDKFSKSLSEVASQTTIVNAATASNQDDLKAYADALAISTVMTGSFEAGQKMIVDINRKLGLGLRGSSREFAQVATAGRQSGLVFEEFSDLMSDFNPIISKSGTHFKNIALMLSNIAKRGTEAGMSIENIKDLTQGLAKVGGMGFAEKIGFAMAARPGTTPQQAFSQMRTAGQAPGGGGIAMQAIGNVRDVFKQRFGQADELRKAIAASQLFGVSAEVFARFPEAMNILTDTSMSQSSFNKQLAKLQEKSLEISDPGYRAMISQTGTLEKLLIVMEQILSFLVDSMTTVIPNQSVKEAGNRARQDMIKLGRQGALTEEMFDASGSKRAGR